MIRKTLSAVQAATFAVLLPDGPSRLPAPRATVFFVSFEGWFVTAAHLVTEDVTPYGRPRTDFPECSLQKEMRMKPLSHGGMCQFVELVYVEPVTDFALLKVDFGRNSNKQWLAGRTRFPCVPVSARRLEEGEPVYSFGYPLSAGPVVARHPRGITIGVLNLSPRVTAAIVSSTLEQTTMVMSPDDPETYVLDRALNYGNSGGPIVATCTGHVHAICSRFQPVFIPQMHLKDAAGANLRVMTPSLYGIVSSLGTPTVRAKLEEIGVRVLQD